MGKVIGDAGGVDARIGAEDDGGGEVVSGGLEVRDTEGGRVFSLRVALMTGSCAMEVRG